MLARQQRRIKTLCVPFGAAMCLVAVGLNFAHLHTFAGASNRFGSVQFGSAWLGPARLGLYSRTGSYTDAHGRDQSAASEASSQCQTHRSHAPRHISCSARAVVQVVPRDSDRDCASAAAGRSLACLRRSGFVANTELPAILLRSHGELTAASLHRSGRTLSQGSRAASHASGKGEA